MAKRKREITDAKINRFIRDGRGQGTGADYLPWLRVQEVLSTGRSTLNFTKPKSRGVFSYFRKSTRKIL